MKKILLLIVTTILVSTVSTELEISAMENNVFHQMATKPSVPLDIFDEIAEINRQKGLRIEAKRGLSSAQLNSLNSPERMFEVLDKDTTDQMITVSKNYKQDAMFLDLLNNHLAKKGIRLEEFIKILRKDAIHRIFSAGYYDYSDFAEASGFTDRVISPESYSELENTVPKSIYFLVETVVLSELLYIWVTITEANIEVEKAIETITQDLLVNRKILTYSALNEDSQKHITQKTYEEIVEIAKYKWPTEIITEETPIKDDELSQLNLRTKEDDEDPTERMINLTSKYIGNVLPLLTIGIIYCIIKWFTSWIIKFRKNIKN